MKHTFVLREKNFKFCRFIENMLRCGLIDIMLNAGSENSYLITPTRKKLKYYYTYSYIQLNNLTSVNK